MYTADQIHERVAQWSHESFAISVESPNSFTTIIRLTYTEPWLGDEHDAVSDCKDEYEIRYTADEFMLMLPTATCTNQQVPEPDWYDIDRQGAVRHATLDDVQTELYSGIAYDHGVFDWLGDFIERWRFQRYSDVLPGVGPVNCQRLYDEYDTLRAMHTTPFDTLTESMSADAAEQLSSL